MLRTNSKKFRTACRAELIAMASDCMSIDYGMSPSDGKSFTFEEVATRIWQSFNEEFYDIPFHHRLNRQDAFVRWCMGIPSLVPFVCSWECKTFCQQNLEQTEAEAERFTESDSELLLAKVFYSEITKALNV